ncbi:multicopper oxidase domain-containing protein [Streptantibioticus rubrisoli]|uniref:Multicopper oxidase domain-containing protein n=1 Tax=Streptantibioticus rubrisoli TaxID=1387313 RepID=A0ABT1PEM4_9ACTN|nr:multicopper oxidase domain-containing protein [Streptantibioticus rubrisoli]MCQ4043826.1 multicopper oxidase domain-containing protein [Streptantibioticus rubrisoli]
MAGGESGVVVDGLSTYLPTSLRHITEHVIALKGHARITARHTVVYTENAAGTEFYINGKQFDPNRVDFTSHLNTVEEWTVRNDTDEEHSFHLHTNHLRVMSINGAPAPRGHAWYETFNIPVRGSAVIRTRFTDFVGKTVLHCHLLNHEDKGMMAVLNIVPSHQPITARHGGT